MWTRKEIKKNAKAALKGRYWLTFLVSFLAVVIISGSLMGNIVPVRHSANTSLEARYQQDFSHYESEFRKFVADADTSGILPIFGIIIAAIILIGIFLGLLAICFIAAYMIFISNPVIVGQNRFYLDNRKGRIEAGKLLSSFGADYKNIVKVMFFKNLRVFLWSLLFIVPGIIKGIEYMMVDYLIADYPKMNLERALKLSSGITGGQKWEIFKLYLSFIGWIILCLITAGIGFAFLHPYIQATGAELYSVLIDRRMVESQTDSEMLPEAPADVQV